MEQYDAIAGDYQDIAAAVPLREPEWYSLRLRLGDLAGLSVLDLACGDGMGTRLLKRWGAACTGASTYPARSRSPMGIKSQSFLTEGHLPLALSR